jgi:acetaldehyde dehydrogenase
MTAAATKVGEEIARAAASESAVDRHVTA